MNRPAFLVFATSMVFAVCASQPARSEPGELITYETQPAPFCGRCDTIKLEASSDGRVRIERGHWAGRYRDWRIVRKTVRVTPEQFASFREALAPYRPDGELRLNDELPCKTLNTDQGGASVSWRGGGADAHLAYNRGCDGEARAAMVKALEVAPSSLGLQTPSW